MSSYSCLVSLCFHLYLLRLPIPELFGNPSNSWDQHKEGGCLAILCKASNVPSFPHFRKQILNSPHEIQEPFHEPPGNKVDALSINNKTYFSAMRSNT